MTYKDINDFLSKRPDIKELRRLYAKYPNIVDLLKGDFADLPANKYPKEKPVVASWVINQGLDGKPKKNPTYGYMVVGVHEFDLGEYAERMTVLDGELEMETTKASFELSPGQGEDIPANSHVLFSPKLKPVIYICEYEKT